ncbi:MAG: C40 family peptidase [Saprospiraceae bacterium]
MSETSDHLSTPKRLLIFCLLLISFFANSAFTAPTPAPGRAVNSAEVMQLREYISGYAQNFIGIPYHYAGHAPRTGFDCSGFTSYILKEFEVSASPSSAIQSSQGNKIALENVMPGDLVFFGYRGRVHHVAMVVENTAEGIMCVHSTCSRGIIVENISTSKYWKPKILFARDVISGQACE